MNEETLMTEIDQLIDEVIANHLKVSKTYEEALKRAKYYSYGFSHGSLGKIIDEIIQERIRDIALSQRIRKGDSTISISDNGVNIHSSEIVLDGYVRKENEE